MSDDATLAHDLADEVGRALIAAREDLFAHHDTSGVKDAADALAQRIIEERLGRDRPDDVVLSEEAVDDLSRLGAQRVWIVDPLDGTREYAAKGRSDWGVHIALWEAEAETLTAAAVALPAQGQVLSTSALVADPEVAPSWPEPLRMVVSINQPQLLVESLARSVPLQLQLAGSVAAKMAMVVRGEADAYVHETALNEWDTAAPVAVARAHGLHTSHLDGSPLTFNHRTAITTDIMICRAELAERLLAEFAPLLPSR